MQQAFKRDKSKSKRNDLPKVRHITKRQNERFQEYMKRALKQKSEKESKVLSDEVMEDLINTGLKAEPKMGYNRSRVMFMGEAGRGKTATINNILGNGYNPEDSVSRVQVFDVNAETWKKYDKIEEVADDVLSFHMWDFSAERVFNVLHHLFMTEYTFYIVIFDATRVLDEETRAATLSQLKFWLFSKKVHAPSSPLLLVGTFCEDLDTKQLSIVDEVLNNELLGSSAFGEVTLDEYCFLPIDNKTGLNREKLKKTITESVRIQDYVKEEVVMSFMKVFTDMVATRKAIFDEVTIEGIMHKQGIADDDVSSVCLRFLASRGLIIYFHQHNLLRRFVIINPEWLIAAIGDVVFDHHASGKKPEFDAKYSRDYRKFKKDSVISKQLLFDIWKKVGFDYRTRKFLLRVLLQSSIIGEYNFDNRASFLVPRLFRVSETEAVKIDESLYEGPSFVIDFSGEFDSNIVADDGELYVKYLPFGLFERLVCLCVEHSARFEESRQPLIGYKIARLSFGIDVDFIVKTGVNHNNEPLRIQIFTETDTSYTEAQDLVKTLFSMTQGLKTDLFTSSNKEKSKLAMTLVLPSSKETGEMLACYQTVRSLREAAKGKDKKFRPSKMHGMKLYLSAYDAWFTDEESLTPNKSSPEMRQSRVSTFTKTIIKPVPKGLKYHCFLSYKQSSAIDIVGKQYFILKAKGFKCWYDQEHQGELNLESMQKGVRNSMCYILFLSQDIFPSYYIEEEVKIAVAEKKPIIFLHHPNTGQFGYWGFHQYIEQAPEILKPFFSTVESIQLQRRYYLEEAVTQLLVKRITDISDELE